MTDHPRDDDENREELRLSPSENFAHDAALRVSGAAKQEHPRKTQRALASIVLGFELFVVFLVGLTVFGLNLLEPSELGIWGALAVCALIVVALGTMRLANVGIWLGWAIQVLLLCAGFILPAALIVGVLFTATWVFCMVRGARIDRERERWAAGQMAEH